MVKNKKIIILTTVPVCVCFYTTKQVWPLLSVLQLRLAAQLCLTLCDSTDYSPSGCSVHENSPGKNTEVGCHSLLQDLNPTSNSNYPAPSFLWIRADALKKMPQP